MAKPGTRKARTDAAPAALPTPEMAAEFANRLRDPFEPPFMGVLRSNDPLLLERGNGGVALYRDLVRDGKVFACLQKRQLALVGKPWQVEPRVKDSPKASADAARVTEILKGFAFDRLCLELMEALIAGHAVAEIVWTVRDGWVVPARAPKRAQRRFVYVQETENGAPQLRMLTRENMLTGVPVPERKFIVHRVNPQDDNPYGTGLGLQLWWPVFFKRKGIVAWNKLCDRFGSPTPHGKYPRNASQKEKATLVEALQAFSNDGFLATPEGMDVALLESKISGNVTTQEQLARYMDEWIAEVLLGQEPAAHGGGALAAASKERQNVRQDLTQADSDLLSETLNETLLAWICELNGFEPCHVYRQIKEEDDIKSMAEADKLVYDMGYELDEDTLRARYGEGWRKRQTASGEPSRDAMANPAGTSGSPPPGGTGAAASFAEAALASAADDPADPLAGDVAALERAAAPQWAALVGKLQALVESASSLEQLQRALISAWGDLDSTELVRLMAAAMALAELKGMDAVRAETGSGHAS
ncbi:MAG: hypothetical protein Fur0019_16070 [Tibeticola sp.]